MHHIPQRGKFVPQYPQKFPHEPYLFHFLDNDYLDDNFNFVKKYEMRIFHIIDILKFFIREKCSFSVAIICCRNLPASSGRNNLVPDLISLRLVLAGLSIHLRPLVESWQQEFVRKIFHKSQLETFWR